MAQPQQSSTMSSASCVEQAINTSSSIVFFRRFKRQVVGLHDSFFKDTTLYKLFEADAISEQGKPTPPLREPPKPLFDLKEYASQSTDEVFQELFDATGVNAEAMYALWESDISEKAQNVAIEETRNVAYQQKENRSLVPPSNARSRTGAMRASSALRFGQKTPSSYT